MYTENREMTNAKFRTLVPFEGEGYGQGGIHRGFQDTSEILVLKLQNGYGQGLYFSPSTTVCVCVSVYR